jgi:hypothetical protein
MKQAKHAVAIKIIELAMLALIFVRTGPIKGYVANLAAFKLQAILTVFRSWGEEENEIAIIITAKRINITPNSTKEPIPKNPAAPPVFAVKAAPPIMQAMPIAIIAITIMIKPGPPNENRG